MSYSLYTLMKMHNCGKFHPRNSLFWEVFGPLFSQYSPALPTFSTEIVLQQTKTLFENFSVGFVYLWKRDGPKVGTFGPTLTPLFLLNMVNIEKNKQQCGKTLFTQFQLTSCKKSFGLNIFQFCSYRSQGTFQKNLKPDFQIRLVFLVPFLHCLKT